MYRVRTLCYKENGEILKQKIIIYNLDPVLDKAQAQTYAYRKMKQIERQPGSFLQDLELPEATFNGILDVELSFILNNKGKKKEYFLLSLNKTNEKNLRKEKKLLERFKRKRKKERFVYYKKLLKLSPNPEKVLNEPYSTPCYFKAKKLKKNEEGEDEIIEVQEFRPLDFNNYLEMQKAAMDYHFSSIPVDNDPLEQMNLVINGMSEELEEYCELYLVIREEDESENEILRLRDNQVNLDGFNIDNYLELLCLEDMSCFWKAKFFHEKKRNFFKIVWIRAFSFILNFFPNFKL
ncbi:hypothetical protein C7S20_05635 [Christiangramia fulva]|uniref:Uncharacterized protein n=2 Tax=Christiangramia fulva TaxID=2126553 RepID=A0A2R3Z3F8_9FLAO|nr:hypothetical protein C7S20_05635 [Christiangramia fulva]